MKKPIIALSVLAVLAGVSVGAFLIVKDKNDQNVKQEQEKIEDRVLFQMDNISRLDIYIDDTVYTAELSEDYWYLSNPVSEKFVLNQDKLKSMEGNIANLTAVESYGEANDEKKKTYGLDNPFKVTAYDGEKVQTLYIGDVSPTGNYYYAMTDTKNNVYAIEYSSAVEILTDRIGLKNKSFISYSDTDVKEMILVKNGETVYDVSFNSENGLWNLPQKYSLLAVNHTVPSNLLTLITRLEAQQLLEDNLQDLSKYNFDNPIAEFTVKANDGSQETILFSDYGTDDNYTYALLKNTNQVALFYTADIKFINYSTEDFIMNTIEGASLYNISGFEFSCNDAEDSFLVNASEGKAECRGYDIDLSNAEIFGFFKTFYNSFSYMYISDIDVEKVPNLENPIFTATYYLNDGTDKTMQFVQSEKEGEAYVFIDGVYSGSLTSTEFIYGKDSSISKYRILCEHTGIES